MYFTKRPSISFHYGSSNEDGIKEDETASTFTANMTSQASSLSLDSEGKETMKRMQQMNNQLSLHSHRSSSRELSSQYIPRQIATVQVHTEQGHLAEKMSKMSELNTYALSSLQKQITAMKSQLEQIPSMMNAQLQRQIIPSMHYEMNKRFELEQKKSEHLERWVTMMASELGYEDWTPSIANFVYNIKNITSQMRRGELVNQNIYLNGCYSTTDDNNTDEAILRYDDQFIPYWKTFADALQHTKIDFDASTNNRSHFAIHNIQLSSTILAMIALALQGKKIDIFRLWGNEYKSISDGIDFAIDVIQNNEIKDFQWVNTTIDNMVHVTRLLEVLSTHQSLERIRLENCCNAKDVDGYSILCSIITEHAHILGINLDSNMIRPMGTHLTHFLTTNPPLNELSLQDNLLDNDDARLIANALKHNTNLRKLHLYGNNITDDGCTAIGSTLFDRSSLNSAATSNHTCMVSGIDLEECSNNNYDLPERNKHLKIYALLSVDKDDSKVRELGDSEDFERRRNFLQISGLNTSGPSKSLQSVTMRRKRADSSSWNLGSTDSLSTAISATSTSDGSNNDAVYVFKNEMLSSSPQTSALTMSSDCDSSVSSSSSSSSASADEEYARQNSSCSDFCSCNQADSRSISHSVGCRRSLFFTQDVGIDISSRSAQTWQHFCFHDSLDLEEEKEDSRSLPGDRDNATWTKQDSLALLGQGRVRI